MEHPPVPPNSKFFGSNPRTYFRQSDEYWPWLEHLKGSERVAAAAVAEVEWLKRAERWEALALNYYNDVYPCVREQYCWDMMGIAKKNALAWRAWGEQ